VSALGACVGDTERFAAEIWGRRPFLYELPPGHPLPFEGLGSLADLDRMISSLGLRLPSFRMVKDGDPLPVSRFTKTERGRDRNVEGVIDPSLVFDRFHEGATIVLEGLQKHWRPMAVFARDLELDLGHRVQVNAYITPPGSQGFATHRDDHDVFVLQTAGSKRWTVLDDKDERATLIEGDVRRGDCLYIPKGFPHSATTTAALSAHLTVGILTHSSMDILNEIVKLADDEGVFGARLPLKPAGDAARLRDILDLHLDELGRWLEKLDREELAWRVTRRLGTTRLEIVGGQLEQSERLVTLDDDTRVGRRKGAICMLRAGGGRLRVLLSDRELEMPPEAEDPMAFVSTTPSFRVRDLDPWLDGAGRRALVTRLVREGLLEVAVDD
jgi:mannose-6-phosphate isomerase-like protein (cupin superfamily)